MIAGGIGLVGLLRVLTLPRRKRPKSHRVYTLGMVAVGLVALLIFNLAMLGGPISDVWDGLSIAAFVYLVLPFYRRRMAARQIVAVPTRRPGPLER